MSLSVVIPTYNRKALLIEAAESVLAQGSPVDELIVIDDGSTDGTEAAFLAWAQGRPQVKYLRTANGGVQAARNRGIELATSAWTVFLDSDDLLALDFAAQLRSAMQQHADVDAFFVNFRFFTQVPGDQTEPDKFSQVPAWWWRGATYSGRIVRDVPELYRRTFRFQPLFQSGFAIRTALARALGGYSLALRGVGGEDWEFVLRVIQHGTVALITGEPLAWVRRHAHNDSGDIAYMKVGEATVLQHAVAHHAPGDALRREMLSERRRLLLDGASFYFLRGEFERCLAVLAEPDTLPLPWKARIKRVVCRLPRPARTALHRLLTGERLARA